MSPVDSGDDDDLLNSSRLSYPALWLYSPYVSVLLCRSPPVYPPVPVSQPRDPPLGQLFPVYCYPALTRILHVRSDLFCICSLHVNTTCTVSGSLSPSFLFPDFFAMLTCARTMYPSMCMLPILLILAGCYHVFVTLINSLGYLGRRARFPAVAQTRSSLGSQALFKIVT